MPTTSFCDRDLAVVVPHRRRARLEERDGQPRRGRGIRHRPVERRDLLLTRKLVFERVEPRFELRDLAAILQEVGDDRFAPGDLALERAQLRAQLRDLSFRRSQEKEIRGGGDYDRSHDADDELLRSGGVDDGVEDRRQCHVSSRTGR